MKALLSKSKTLKLAVLIFSLLSAWWVYLHFIGTPSDTSLEWFSGTYGVMALFGAVVGLRVSKEWGGRKSLIGRAILMFAFGLLAQEFGQITYSLYTLLFHIEVPYPSIGDIGYFGSVLFYLYGVWLIGKVVGLKFSLKSYADKLSALVIPLAILATSYGFFLKGYEFDWASPVTVFLDFGYPLGQAFYISLAILVYILSRKYLGGIMRPVILTVLFALCVQYVADFMFLYQTNHETWTTAGLNDYVYLVSYFVMTLALLKFKTAVDKLGSSGTEKAEG
jgi:hypothetical protein